jgi:dUTPase
MPICAEAIMSYGGRVYVKQGISLSEVELLEAGGSQVFAGSTTVCPVLQHATRLFDGVVVQDVFGSCYANVFPQSKTCLQYHIKELDGAKIIDAKYDNGVMMFVAFQGGKYNKYIVRTASDLSYDLRVEKDVGPVTLNFVTLPNGVCVHLNEKEEIEIFTNNLKSSSVKVYDDPALESDMRLSRDGTQVLFAKGNELHSIEVKRP